MINPLSPLFPIHQIELHHRQTRYVTKMGSNEVILQHLNAVEANHYILRLLNTPKYRDECQIIIKIRMNSDRIELRIPLTNGNALVYGENPIEQLLLQWLLLSWTSLSKQTMGDILELNLDILTNENYSNPSNIPLISNNYSQKSFFKGLWPNKSSVNF